MDEIIKKMKWLKDSMDNWEATTKKLKNKVNNLANRIEILKNKGLLESEISKLIQFLDSTNFNGKTLSEIEENINNLEVYVEELEKIHIKKTRNRK
jgi:archaellum component FlaC